MKSSTIYGLIALVALFAVSSEVLAQSNRPYFDALSKEEQALVELWLVQDCEIGQIQEFDARLGRYGDLLEPVFWEAYKLGPTPEDLKETRDVLVKRFAERGEWLRTSGGGYLTVDEKHRLLSVSRDQYLEQGITRYIIRYKTAAIKGLAVVGTGKSLVELEKIAGEKNNPAREAARESIIQVRKRGMK